MKLGTKVKYIRQKNDGTIEEGEGIIHALSFDKMRRRTAFLDIGGEGINVDFAALNPTDEFKAQFREYTAEVKRLTDEGNAAVAKLVAKHNKRIDKLHNKVIGRPMQVEIMPPRPTPEGEQATSLD